MKFIIAAGLTLCLAPNVLSSAIPVLADTSPALDKRVVPDTPPQGAVVCRGYSVPDSDILAAIDQGLAWATTDPPTQMGKPVIRSSSLHSIPFPIQSPIASSSSLQLAMKPEYTVLTNHLLGRLIQVPAHLQQLRRPQLPQLRRLDSLGIPRAPIRLKPMGTGQGHDIARRPEWRAGARQGDICSDEREFGYILRHHHA